MKEAVEDLEWPGSSVAVKLTQDPPALSLSAHGTGSLEVGVLLLVVVCVDKRWCVACVLCCAAVCCGATCKLQLWV